MKRHRAVLLIALFVVELVVPLPAADEPRAEGLHLASDGKALLPVVISKLAPDSTRRVATELADYLSRITGARFEVQVGDSTRGIVLGTLSEFPQPDLTKALEIRNTYDGKEAFAIRTERQRLLLLGATDLGASHAAFRFLESVGCRWFFPARAWEVIPKRPTLSVALNATDRPALLARRIWYTYAVFDAGMAIKYLGVAPKDRNRSVDDYEAWSRHNRMASSLTIQCGHVWQSIIGQNQKTFDAHPEYLALVKGKRQGEQLCVSNPQVRQLATRWALDQLKSRPHEDMVSMETSDGGGHCECEQCRKLGGISERVFGLANEVARAVARQYPGKMVGMLAYGDHCEPPSFALEPNVFVMPTAGFITGKYTFPELMELWPKRCKNVGFYEYLSEWLWDFDQVPGGRGANLKYLRERLPRYVQLGAISVDCESSNNWGVHGRGYYLANQLMWDPKTDVDALLADFYQQAFGPAAAVMKRYYERLDPGTDPLVSEHLLGLALRDLEEASELARDRPDVLARLDHLKQYQHYVRLRWEHDHTSSKDHKRELTLAALTHGYRTRYSYMNHWSGMQAWTVMAAKEFNEPSWVWREERTAKPWKVEAPYTPEETEKRFRADLQFFQPQPYEEKTFSADLIPAGLHTAVPAAADQNHYLDRRYGLYSPKGEPLDLTIIPGTIAWYRDRADAAYTMMDAAGKEIGTARLPLDGKEHVLSIKVPRAGLYWLDFHGRGAGWTIKTAAGQPAVLVLHRAERAVHLVNQRMYFYVPKGQREIHYFWDGQPHEVCDPDGKVVAKVNARGKFVTVAVPNGADGQAWSLARLFSPSHLWFLDVPNYLAASPDALLVPCEVLAGQEKKEGTPE
jgi:hypothetical protein